MTEASCAADDRAVRWTCPFCALLCDDLEIRVGAALDVAQGECARARPGLARFAATPSPATPCIDGQPAGLDEAIDAAARLLQASRQPLFGGLDTDVEGARAVYRLACAVGAICDAAGGDALMQGVRALQDRGGYATTLAEVRTRADLLVCLGGPPDGDAADFIARCGAAAEVVPLEGDPFSTVPLLSALIAGRAVRDAPAPLVALAGRLRAARYAVIVGQTARLPAHGELVIEGVQRIVAELNRTTRAAALWLGAGGGAGTVNEVFTWLSGLPLRTRAGPAGLEHEPRCFDAGRLIADAAVDSLLWIACFDPACAPPAAPGLPLVVLGHPDLAASASHAGSVFIPVSTPGIGSQGHLFRTDGGVVLPLAALYRDTLPTLAEVLGRIAQALPASRGAARAAG